jgi:hypothetical protein
MADDIRLAIDMDHNPKVRRLIQELGPEAAWALVRLWLYTARHRPEGVLTGIELDEIEPLVGWKRRRGRLIDALERLGFITVRDTGTSREVTIHEWFVHQPWVSGQKHRSEVARINAQARWRKLEGEKPEAPEKKNDTDADRTADGNTDGNTDTMLLAFPSPPPSQDLGASAPAGPSEGAAVPPEPYRGSDACAHPAGCHRRGTKKVDGRWYCRHHDPDRLREQDILGGVLQGVTQ